MAKTIWNAFMFIASLAATACVIVAWRTGTPNTGVYLLALLSLGDMLCGSFAHLLRKIGV